MFTIDRSVLLLIDVQGRLAQLMYEKESLFQSIQIMIQSMQILGVPILWMEQIPEKLGRTHEGISQLLPDQTPIEKSSFSCCGDPMFMERFNQLNRDQVLLTGIETHICVCQTGIGLIENKCQVQVVTDCVSSRTKANKEIGIRRLSQEGARVTSLEMVLFELLGDAKAGSFRQIARLIK